ncbi:MAG TPA: MFS transporter [Sphingopyxis sp.]|uniref:MFS transporter n=1 Tax=Sphingopyxis sp. TaxID=1908224 RepID=UPI002B560542|nr:MFS transporter [Sphingopyxis sp.]HWW58309.1 MFS transporter [Sphingopyxis sp.]
MPQMPIVAPPIGLRTKLFFGIGSLAQGAKTVAYSAYLLIFYNQVMGVPAALVSTALLVSLVIDAISNPILGQISDNTRSRWGRRHPYMYAAALPTALFFWAMFNPPAGLSHGAMFWYILIVSMLGRVAINLYELPSAALTPELTGDYDERTSLMTWRYFFGYVGGLGIGTLLFFVLLQPTAEYPVGQLNPEGYHRLGVIGAILIFVSILACSYGTHDRIRYARQAEDRPPQTLGAHMRELFQTLSHRGFLALLAFGVMKYTAAGMYAAMAVYFGTFVWELSPTSMGLLTFDGVVAATIALVIAPRLSKRYGKKPVAVVLAIVGVTISLTPLALRQLGLFLPNDPESTLVIVLFAFAAFYGAATATSQIMTSAMIADVVEDSLLKTGRHSSGVFFAASSFMQTCTAGFGVLGAGLVLSVAGFPQGAKPGEVPAETISTLIAIYLPVAALLWFVGVFFLTFYRIDRAAHEANLSRLAAAGPIQGEVEAAEPDFTLADRSAPAR